MGATAVVACGSSGAVDGVDIAAGMDVAVTQAGVGRRWDDDAGAGVGSAANVGEVDG